MAGWEGQAWAVYPPNSRDSRGRRNWPDSSNLRGSRFTSERFGNSLRAGGLQRRLTRRGSSVTERNQL